MTDDFVFHREPLAHQRRDFERFKRAPWFGLFFQQRCGKTKLVLDIFRYRYGLGDVDALVVIAFPNGVHRIWLDEAPKDFPPDFLTQTKVLPWSSGKMTGGERRDVAIGLRSHLGPIVFTMNCEAVITQDGRKYLEWLFAKRKVMFVADEASFMSNWTTRTRAMLTLSQHRNVVVRAILDGTPVDEGPEDIFYPAQFLQPGCLGFRTKVAFRAQYLKFEMEETEDGQLRRKKFLNYRTNSYYEKVVGTRNLEELGEKLRAIGSRVLRSEVSDAPAKTYTTRYFDLTNEQRALYDRLRDKFVVELATGTIRVADVLTRMTRLQMIARGYYPPEAQSYDCAACVGSGYTADGEDCPRCVGVGMLVEKTGFQRIGTRNPAADALLQEVAASRWPTVVWCRFRQDTLDAHEALRNAGYDARRYDGSLPEAEREVNYQAFRAGEYNYIVGTIASGLQRGKDLRRAGLLVFYSNEWSRRSRSQAEDRAEGLAETESTDIVDLVASDTRDIAIIEALRNKQSIAAMITGDNLKEWL